MIALPRIDFARVPASAGDLRGIVAGSLGSPDHSGRFHCPFHGGGGERTQSLQVWADHFHCFGCGEHGDAIGWLMRREGLTAVQAAKRIDPSIVTAEDLGPARKSRAGDERPQIRPSPPSPSTAPMARREAPEIWADPAWQSRASALIRHAESILWSPAGRPALDWLRRRGLEDLTIKRFRLGFLHTSSRTESIPHWLDDRGRTRCLRAERGITIPWLAPGAWYSEEDGEPDGPRWVGMNIRRLAEDVNEPLPDGADKCRAVAGSKRGRLYPLPTIEPTQGHLPILLVEGEFDALIGLQEAGHVLHVGTVGSASTSARGLPRETRAALARCTWLLLALDCDAAGAENVRRWREAYPHKSRRVLLPAGKDLNEFVSMGGDLTGWLAEISDRLGRSSGPPAGRTVGGQSPEAGPDPSRPDPRRPQAAQDAPGPAPEAEANPVRPRSRDGLLGHPGAVPAGFSRTVSLTEVRKSIAELGDQLRPRPPAAPAPRPRKPHAADQVDQRHILSDFNHEEPTQ